MTYQIDQSGKIEQTEKYTVLALSNENHFAVILSAKNKRRLQEMFRILGAPRLFIDYVFAALVEEIWAVVCVSGEFLKEKIKEKTGGCLNTGLSPANRRSDPVLTYRVSKFPKKVKHKP